MSYADSRNIPYIVIAGDAEIKNNEVTVKVMKTGEQKKLSLARFEAVLASGLDGLQQ
jgi:histidyl-tRNA synthetase